MQLVLLSGGSGKRLWPLSNNARSKQFLKLLEKGDGTLESMVQRVVRQINLANLTSEITIATNASQRDIIINQLGDSVNLVTEPERRDTFPAIALSAAYLRLVKRCHEDEVVVVMPCDPYTDLDYFKTISKMVEHVEENAADLILMGIHPTYPSEKYGYIVPDKDQCINDSTILRVSHFTEKPSVEKAYELLREKAYWNGGVFAFRLDFLLKIIQKYISLLDSSTGSFVDFEYVHSHYALFPRISFDYEVVEKAKSVAVVPFAGEWKDLGTWNALTEILHKPIIGNAVMGEHCRNTHVVSELRIPIYVDGLDDVIVAACPDGILVCNKRHSEEIKSVVEDFTSRPMSEGRRGETCRVLDYFEYSDGIKSLTKNIMLQEGKSTSYHIHRCRSEVWTFVNGEGVFVLDGVEKYVKAGDVVSIPVGHRHCVKALTQLSIIEVQMGTSLIDEDAEVFEWIFGNN